MASVTGLSTIKANVRKYISRKLVALTRGLKTCGALILRDSQQIVPVDYGPLKASAFIRTEGDGTTHVVVIVGYTAAYAVYVHEDLDKAHGAVFNALYAVELAKAKSLRRKKQGGTTGPFRHSRGPNQQAKFLEIPFRDRRDDCKTIITAEVNAP